MKHHTARTALACSLTLTLGLAAAAPHAAAQDAAAVDDDVATTPTGLAELLGPDGLAGVETEFYLRMAMTGPGGEAGTLHWATTVEGDRLVCTMSQLEDDGSSNVSSQVYDLKDGFVQSSESNMSPDYQSTETAVRTGDKVRVTSSYAFDGEPAETDEEVHTYTPLEDAIPTSWLPLALAYHIREGHEVYTLRMSDDVTGQFNFVQTYYIEDVGTEVIQVLGEEVETHVLMMTMGMEMDGEPMDGPGEGEDQVMQVYVLPNGALVRMRAEFDGMTMSAEAISAEEVAELMLGADAGDEDAGEGDE